MHYKPWSSMPWAKNSQSRDHEPVQVLKSKPAGIPELIKPDFREVDSTKLLSTVEKAIDIGAFDERQKESWDSFIARIRERETEVSMASSLKGSK